MQIRLDRKSSRGMIYENEELRLRTININAEVERGQTDIKRLRRENDQLKREIWSLRDECDRLNKRINTKLLDQERCNCHVRGSGGSSGCTRCPSQSNTDDSDSCDTCKGGDDCDDGHCSDDCSQLLAIKQKQQQQQNMGTAKTNNVKAASTQYPKFSEPQPLHNTSRTPLSVVSEETLSNSEVPAALQQQRQLNEQQQQKNQPIGDAYSPSANGSQTTLPSLMGQLTPLTPLELVANQLNDLQAVVPPLSYFENILQEHMGSTIGMTPDTACISPNKKTIKHTNGWDYNFQSPFANRRISPASSTSSPSSASINAATIKQRYPPGPSIISTLTTFLPTTRTPPTIVNASDGKAKHNINANKEKVAHTYSISTSSTSTQLPMIETVAITTMPTTAPPPPPTLGSPKNFFSLLKPRLKINTSLANKNSTIPTPPIVPISTATGATKSEFQNCDPPDIYVTNALASPYKRPSLAPTQSPQLPQRSMNGKSNSSSSSSTSPPNVSSRCHRQHHYHHQHQQHVTHQRHQRHQHLQIEKQRNKGLLRPNKNALTTATVSVLSYAIDVPVDDDVHEDVNFGDINIDAALFNNKATTLTANLFIGYTDNDSYSDNESHSAAYSDTDSTTLDACSIAYANSMPLLINPVEHCMACFIKPNDPIYAIARERSNSLISANARTKPLMTATIYSPSNVSMETVKLSSISAKNLSQGTVGHQTESINLETMLNDIEHISEDILAIQLENNKFREKQCKIAAAQTENNKPLQQDDKNKKPYRSEMNLQLSYDGANPTIKPGVTTDQFYKTTINDNGTNVLRTRARSLERETTDSPSPKIPDAMPAFPEIRAYIGFDKLNSDTKSQLQCRKLMPGLSKSNTSSPKKLTPPAPPTRLCPPPLNVRNGSLPTVHDTPTTPQALSGEPIKGGQVLTPNRSHLYKALANAAAKRAQFRLDSPTLSKSLDLDLTQNIEFETPISVTTFTTEADRLKGRRVSIVCGDNPSTPEVSPTVPATPTLNSILLATTQPTQLSTGSCTNLTATPTNPILQSLKQVTSQSTPNSPHSARKRNDNGLSNADIVRQHSSHQYSCSNNSNTPQQYRRSSQDSMRDMPATATVTPVAARSRCSRRHSDGTAAVGNAQRISGSSAGHHHHHHRHQHSSSLVSNSHNQHHLRHSNQDSNQETGSVSDRNSNSFSSSRESSASFSMRSQRRKISVSSNTGGKIPWCGCWGNGCL